MIHVIHNPARTERLASLQRELAGIPYRLWPAVMASDFATGCALAHMQVATHILDTGAKFGIVAEDDLHWTAPGAWQRFQDTLAHMPDGWDLLLGGISYGTAMPLGDIASVGKFSGTHLYAASRAACAAILNCPASTHLDEWLSNHDIRVAVCWPIVAVQHAGYSDQFGGVRDYTSHFARYPFWSG